MSSIKLSKSEAACLRALVRTAHLTVDQLFAFKHGASTINSLDEKGLIQVAARGSDVYMPTVRGRDWVKANPS